MRPDERWAIIGKSGSGKSVFARWVMYQYLRAHWPVVIVDPKRRYVDAVNGDSFAKAPQESSIASPWQIKDGIFNPDAKVQIYLPTIPAKRDPALDRLYFSLLERGGVVLENEDLTQIADENTAPQGFLSLLTDGRTSEVVMLNLAQRPFEIPTHVYAQAENYVCFRMTVQRDLDRMAEIMGDIRVRQRKIPRRYFWYEHDGDDAAQLMLPLPAREVVPLGGIRPEDKSGRPREDESA